MPDKPAGQVPTPAPVTPAQESTTGDDSQPVAGGSQTPSSSRGRMTATIPAPKVRKQRPETQLDKLREACGNDVVPSVSHCQYLATTHSLTWISGDSMHKLRRPGLRGRSHPVCTLPPVQVGLQEMQPGLQDQAPATGAAVVCSPAPPTVTVGVQLGGLGGTAPV